MACNLRHEDEPQMNELMNEECASAAKRGFSFRVFHVTPLNIFSPPCRVGLATMKKLAQPLSQHQHGAELLKLESWDVVDREGALAAARW